MSRWFQVFLFGLVCSFGDVARADEEAADPAPAVADAAAPPPAAVGGGSRDRLFYTNSVFGRINPLGLQDIFRLGYRRDLIRRPGSLFTESYLFVGAAVNLSPAFARVGPHIEFAPVSVLKLEASYQAVGWFGALDQLTTWDTTNPDFSDRALDDLDERAGFGHLVMLGGRAQVKGGPIVLRNILELNWYDANLADGDISFYEQFWDRLVVDRKWMVRNDLDLLGVYKKARFGARYTYSDTFLGDGSSGDMPHHRVGPLFAWEFHDRGQGARFDKPTLFVLAQWWITHPYRAGQQQPQALPLIAVGSSWQGDLLGPRRAEAQRASGG
jgi:hypothetical protein